VLASRDPGQRLQAQGDPVGLVGLPAQQQALLDQLRRPPGIALPPRHDPEVPQRVGPEVDLTVQFGDRENLLVAGGRPRRVAEQPAGKREPEPGRELPTDLARSAERVEDLSPRTHPKNPEASMAWARAGAPPSCAASSRPCCTRADTAARSPCNPASTLST
jgi:hypothetical protein